MNSTSYPNVNVHKLHMKMGESEVRMIRFRIASSVKNYLTEYMVNSKEILQKDLPIFDFKVTWIPITNNLGERRNPSPYLITWLLSMWNYQIHISGSIIRVAQQMGPKKENFKLNHRSPGTNIGYQRSLKLCLRHKCNTAPQNRWEIVHTMYP